MEQDQLSQIVPVTSPAIAPQEALVEPEMELDIFVPFKPKSVRTARGIVVERIVWKPDPVVPDMDDVP